ncbi:MAG: S9 family peptidase [Balneolaceae bacterium]|nr:MAG: S9 family peptidase [Balneolaceae bacterium]
MKLLIIATSLFFIILARPAEARQSVLDVDMIMQDYRTWVGAWPSNTHWTDRGDFLFFNWNPGGAFPADSLFRVPRGGGDPVQVGPDERRTLPPRFSGWQHGTHTYDRDFRRRVFTRDGDVFIYDIRRDELNRLTNTRGGVSNARFTSDNRGVIFTMGGNLYRMETESPSLRQITDIRSGTEKEDRKPSDQRQFLIDQQLELFEYIRQQKERRELREDALERERAARRHEQPYTFYRGSDNVEQLQIDPNERFVTFRLSKSPSGDHRTLVHSYVTEDGYADNLNARAKVGSPLSTYHFRIIDLQRDTVLTVNLHQIEGAYDVPAYLREQGVEVDSAKTKRALVPVGPLWSGDGAYAVMVINALDNKDRWIVRLDPEDGSLTVLDRQTDDAWIGGPGMGGRFSAGAAGWHPDNRRFWFQSEATGYSHLYTVDVATGDITQLTSGEFEVFSPQLSKDGRNWYFSSSEVSPYERHYYRMSASGGAREQLTTLTGNNNVDLHPSENLMGMIYSYSNRVPEVYLQGIGRRSEPRRITHSPTDHWLAYDWRDPEIIEIPASDGIGVPTRIYRPENPNGAAVLFVHGAGYLQNVHRWWSQYFREYMFHNMLTDMGYVVLDLDFRASAGYGRDWRTDIYRHMGGRDLQDYVDASRWLTAQYGIPGDRIGIYGGSYGGFITLMALFTEPDYFGAGAALRSVTDWAHYNHGYTSNILNTPASDSLAYALSSPINFAEGLRDPLLITHGVVDVNVQIQDVMRLAQRLIELRKENWELAVYPVEDHGFTEPASWADQYKRILRIFEENLRE